MVHSFAYSAGVGFRRALFGCLSAWADALFELTDALLWAPGPSRSVPSLSLEPAFRRSHGSLYNALARGRVASDELRRVQPTRSYVSLGASSATSACPGNVPVTPPP